MSLNNSVFRHPPLNKFAGLLVFLSVLSGPANSGDIEKTMDVEPSPVSSSLLLSEWQEGVMGEQLSGLMEEAVKSNPDVLQRKAQLEAAGFDLTTAEWGWYPNLSVDLESTDEGESQLVARVEQPLWTGGRLTSEIDAADASVQAAVAAFDAIKLDTLMKVSSTYYDVIRLSSSLKIAKTNVEEHKRLVEIIERRAASKISAKSDQVQAQARLQRAVTDRIQTEQELAIAVSRLERLINRSVKPLAKPNYVQFGAWNRIELEEKAVAFAPGIRSLQAEIEAARADRELARSGWWPRVVAGVESISNDGNDTDDDTNIYLALRMQTGPGLSKLSSTQAASSRIAASQSALQARTLEVKREVQTYWAQYEGLKSQLDTARVLRKSTEEIVKSYLRQFQVGKKSWLDVLNAQRERTAASYTLANTEYPLLSVQARLLLLSGVLNAANAGDKL